MVAFAQHNELSGYEIVRSPTGWIINFWSRIPEDVDGDSYIYYFDNVFGPDCDFSRPYNNMFSVGDALAIIAREDRYLERYNLKCKCLNKGKSIPYKKKGERNNDKNIIHIQSRPAV